MPNLHAYPRPQLQRLDWHSLNGPWDFAVDPLGDISDPAHVRWSQRIEVPFAPETPASGVEHREFFRACWYRRRVQVPRLRRGHKLLLHFGAVDYRAMVWVDDCSYGSHEGGYTPFTIDITRIARARSDVVITVRAEDDPTELTKPRGKQDWELQPHSIWYQRTTGIWQTVWMEQVPESYVAKIRWTPNLERWEIGCAVWIEDPSREDLHLRVRLEAHGRTLADDQYLIVNHEVHRRIALSDPGIDDYRNTLLWKPASPTLVHATLQLTTGAGQVLDDVRSYTALRSFTTDGERLMLNGRPYYLRMVLDQGYWPDTGLTAPDDAALRKDVELAKAMGFNGVRKHQKLEDPRYLYWADVLGLLVWEEMPSSYRFTQQSIARATCEWLAALERDVSHPCVITWVPFNESWGVPNLPQNPAERHYVDALYHLTKTFDPTRPVVGNDGWESVATDIIGIHDYDASSARLAARYGSADMRPRIFKQERPGGRALVLATDRHAEQPIMLTEFGGITLADDEDRTWGYSRVRSAQDLAEQYRRLISTVRSTGFFAGFCYTQFADTYQEANGLLYGDRTPKFPLEEIAAATQVEPKIPL